MTDIYCSKCGEPWDLYELHDMTGPDDKALSFDAAAKQFSQYGCGAFTIFEKPQACTNAVVDQHAADTAKVMQELSPYPDEWIM